MRAGRFLAILLLISAAGTVLSRPSEVLPAAMHFISPLLAQQSARIGQSDETLPDYIPGSHELSFNGASRSSDQAAVTPQPAPALSSQAPATGSTAPRHVELTAEPIASPSSTATAVLTAPSAAATGAAPIVPILPVDGEVVTLPSPDGAVPAFPETPIVPAKTLFGAAKTPAPLSARSIGSYAHGCLAGGVSLPVDGPAWQAMRLSRNRTWGHPKLINLVERLASAAQKFDGWSGLLVGDISQPRGGPMLTGHASHQVGLDADVWLTPMPNRKLSGKEREDVSATSMLDATDIAVDPKIFTADHVKLIKRAASYPEVERVLVHPAIKKALCEAAGTDRKWLGKVRPIGGHYYHFHIRIACPPGSTGCMPQKPPTGEDGCGKEVQEWLVRLAPSKTPPLPKPPGYKPPPPKPPLTMAQLPSECTAVLESGPDGVPVPSPDKMDLKMIANMPAALRPHLRKYRSAHK